MEEDDNSNLLYFTLERFKLRSWIERRSPFSLLLHASERLEVYLPLNMWLVGVEHNLAPLQTLLQQPRLWGQLSSSVCFYLIYPKLARNAFLHTTTYRGFLQGIGY